MRRIPDLIHCLLFFHMAWQGMFTDCLECRCLAGFTRAVLCNYVCLWSCYMAQLQSFPVIWLCSVTVAVVMVVVGGTGFRWCPLIALIPPSPTRPGDRWKNNSTHHKQRLHLWCFWWPAFSVLFALICMLLWQAVVFLWGIGCVYLWYQAQVNFVFNTKYL